MEHKTIRKLLSVLILAVIGTSCREVDFSGMVLPEESANDRFEQSMTWNQANPFQQIVVASDNYTVLTASDIHVGTTVNLDKLITLAKNTSVAAVVLPGDLTYGSDEEYELFDQHLPARDYLMTFPIPGNHDLNFNGWSQFYQRFGAATYLFTVITPAATDLFICLESGSATLGRKQIEWLRGILEITRPAFRNCFVFTHTNFFRVQFSEASNQLPAEVIVLLDLFIRNKVDMVIAGHRHSQSIDKFGSTSFIVLPPLKDGSHNAGYLEIDVTEGKIGYDFKFL